MKKENDEIADLFRSGLAHCELPVRDNFWEEIEKDFPVQAVHRPRLTPFRYAAVAAVFLALIGMSATLWLLAPKEEIEEAFTQVAETSGRIKLPGQDVAREALSVVPHRISPQSVLPVVPETCEYTEDSMSVSFSFSFSLSSESDDLFNNDMPDGKVLAGNGSSDRGATQNRAVYSPGKKKKGWAVGVHALAATSSMGKAAGSDYKMPVSVGLSVSKQLTDRWALETGLDYTMLRSDVPQQKAHYIGIPVKASYTVLDKKKVDVYLTGGGLFEKCISTGKDSGIEQPKQMQYALTASAGVQYKIGKNVAVFAEPGIAYNFDNGASTPVIRKEKPLNFNLLCGVRVMY